MTTQKVSSRFLIYELKARVGNVFTPLGLYRDEELAEEEQARLEKFHMPAQYVIVPRVVEA